MSQKRAGSKSCPSQLRDLYLYVNLVLMMITVVAVIAVPAVPVRPIIAIVWIRSVIPVRVIAISVVIAIPRITNPDSD